MTIETILLFIVSFALLIIIHELGHFTMAKLFKVYVIEFAIGFGPVLFKKKTKETQYSVRLLPLGGYVLMFGETDEATKDIVPIDVPRERSLVGVAKWKRALIMSAGIILNFILAFVLFFVSNFAFTQRMLTYMEVTPGSAGATAGVVTGEYFDYTDIKNGTVVGVDQDSVSYTVNYVGFSSYEDGLQDILTFSRTVDDETVYFVPQTIDDTMSFPLTVRSYSDDTNYTISTIDVTFTSEAAPAGSTHAYQWADYGVNFHVQTFRYTFQESIVLSGQQWWRGFTVIGKTIAGLFVGQGLGEVGGIVAIFNTTASIYEAFGLSTYIYVWGLISVNIALFNLLPFPGLDGWHLLVIAVEGITKKEIPSKVKNVISAIGLVILLTLMVLLIFKDIFFPV